MGRNESSEDVLVSPLDTRYISSVSEIASHLSEHALYRNRIIVEVKWLRFLAKEGLTHMSSLDPDADGTYFNIPNNRHAVFLSEICEFTPSDMERIREIERTINHDVKATEYYLRNKLKSSNIAQLQQLEHWIHMFCTSEDINSSAYALGIRDCMEHAIKPMLRRLIGELSSLATELDYMAKFSGAVGNFNVHKVAFPERDWPALAKNFVENHLNLTYQDYSTQIECHDYISEVSDHMSRINSILKDLCVDMWLYISYNIIQQRKIKDEVGSSTMPHKINPVRWECAEGNIGMANALFHFFSSKLTTSRLQRDLSDSTVLRNLGVAFGHSYVAYINILNGLSRVSFNEERALKELDENWVVLSEPLQVILKLTGVTDGYEKVLELTRKHNVTKEEMKKIISQLAPGDHRMESLTAAKYTGYAAYLASGVAEKYKTSDE
ncbi:L-aspartase like protein [Babesia gibsoni]|uniref:L-aspartase like protein n=1 Tax=Babesia gibsoni TaxID=33632 RepID=A0AAD8PFF7_BABGI|nr:L-aspartase like protein [Babesia gibsoni]